MSSIDTALRVVQWATIPSGAPPRGDARGLEQLMRPNAQLQIALGVLAAATCARMRLEAPPLGDTSPLSVASLLLATAVGVGAAPLLASAILRAVPPADHASEWLVRHGVVAPALAFFPQIAEDLRRLSPLTGLLDWPESGGEAESLRVANRLRHHAVGRRALVRWLAEPAQSTPKRLWRAGLLDRWRSGTDEDRRFVLDVYEAAIVYYESDIIGQTRASRKVVTDPALSGDEAQLQAALSVAAWWAPLSAIERTDIESLRSRRYLGYSYREGLALYRLTRKLTGGAS